MTSIDTPYDLAIIGGGLEGGGTIGYVGGLIKAAVTGLIAGESA